MKKLTFLLYLYMAVALFACQKDEEPEMASQEIMRANIDGKTFTARNFVLAKTAQTTSINGTAGSVANPESISISITSMQVGTFQLGETAHYAAYNSPTDEFLSSSGQLIIISINDDWIEGRFEFIARSVNDPSEQVHISNGEFKLQLD